MKKTLLLFSILFSLTSQAQDLWTETNPFNNAAEYNFYHVYNLSLVDESTVWALGYAEEMGGDVSPAVYCTSHDGGLTWTSGVLPYEDNGGGQYTLSSKEYFANIAGVSSQTAYAVSFPQYPGVENKIFVTQDAGISWTRIHPELYAAADAGVEGVHFFDADHGLLFGDPTSGYFEVYTTADAGLTWTRTPSVNIPSPLPSEFFVPGNFETRQNTIWVLTNLGRLFKSTDQGQTWTVSQTPLSGLEMYFASSSFSFKNQNEGLLVSPNNVLYRTTDGGTSWNPEPSVVALGSSVKYVPQTAETYFNLGKIDDENPWYSSYSTDDGNSWTTIIDNPEFQPLLTEFWSSTVGYATGYVLSNPNYRGFYRLNDPLDRLLKTKSFLETAITVAPNPTTDFVKLSGKNIYAVSISDMSGKLVFASDYGSVEEVNLDLSNVQTGIYFANVKSENSVSSTIKIVKY